MPVAKFQKRDFGAKNFAGDTFTLSRNYCIHTHIYYVKIVKVKAKKSLQNTEKILVHFDITMSSLLTLNFLSTK